MNQTRLLLAAFACSIAIADSAPQRFVIVPGRSTASYAVDEVFLRENNRLFTAVGVTRGVSGEIILDRMQPAQSQVSEIKADLRMLSSDSERRDRALREKYLDTRQFPYATLGNGRLTGLPARVQDGRRFTFVIAGDLNVHGTTRATRWQGDAVVSGDTLRGTARTQVKMSDFGIEVPRLLSLRSEDDVIVTIEFVAAAHKP
jgi:polyisoprenoid-binding protein YceI